MFDFDLITASNNTGKLRELKELLNPYFSNISTPSQLGINFEVEETGATFFQNAMLKAEYVFGAHPQYAVLSDDSGIMVDALGGAPGVFSARYAGENADAQANIDKLLNELVNEDDRAAQFFCCLVLILPNSFTNKKFIINVPQEFCKIESKTINNVDCISLTAFGQTTGHILKKRCGTNGFGYDCIFFSDDLEQSFGLATNAQKNKVSHRFRALSNLMTGLELLKYSICI